MEPIVKYVAWLECINVCGVKQRAPNYAYNATT